METGFEKDYPTSNYDEKLISKKEILCECESPNCYHNGTLTIREYKDTINIEIYHHERGEHTFPEDIILRKDSGLKALIDTLLRLTPDSPRYQIEGTLKPIM